MSLEIADALSFFRLSCGRWTSQRSQHHLLHRRAEAGASFILVEELHKLGAIAFTDNDDLDEDEDEEGELESKDDESKGDEGKDEEGGRRASLNAMADEGAAQMIAEQISGRDLVELGFRSFQRRHRLLTPFIHIVDAMKHTQNTGLLYEASHRASPSPRLPCNQSAFPAVVRPRRLSDCHQHLDSLRMARCWATVPPRPRRASHSSTR